MNTLEHLKEEHEDLKETLAAMQYQASRVAVEKNPVQAAKQLAHLRLWTLNFIHEWDQYTQQKQEELFPILDQSFYPIELKRELEHATELFGKFLKIEPLENRASNEQFQYTVDLFKETCEILLERIDREEKLEFPLAEQILADTDLFL